MPWVRNGRCCFRMRYRLALSPKEEVSMSSSCLFKGLLVVENAA